MTFSFRSYTVLTLISIYYAKCRSRDVYGGRGGGITRVSRHQRKFFVSEVQIHPQSWLRTFLKAPPPPQIQKNFLLRETPRLCANHTVQYFLLRYEETYQSVFWSVLFHITCTNKKHFLSLPLFGNHRNENCCK